jgi:hypothetical protein
VRLRCLRRDSWWHLRWPGMHRHTQRACLIVQSKRHSPECTALTARGAVRFRLLKLAGSVLTVAVATLRKTVTVVLSYLIFPKELRAQHVLSFVAVGAGLLLYEVAGQLKKRREAAGLRTAAEAAV